MTNRTLLAGSAALVLGVVAVAVVASSPAQAPQSAVSGFTAPADIDTSALRGPRQPIFYRHDVHAGQYEIDCRYCHFSVEYSSSAGLPTLSTCMGCHRLAGLDNPEVQRLQEFAFSESDSVRLEWVEVHRLAPFVHFPHMRHVKSVKGEFETMSITEKCESCHGPIRRMVQVYQFSSLKMGWCVDCHRKSEVTTDCTACHY